MESECRPVRHHNTTMVTIELFCEWRQVLVCVVSMVTVFQWSSAWLELLQTLVDSPDGRWHELLPDLRIMLWLPFLHVPHNSNIPRSWLAFSYRLKERAALVLRATLSQV